MPAQSRKAKGHFSGPGSLDLSLQPAPSPLLGGGVAWPGVGILCFLSPPSRVTILWAAPQPRDTWGQMGFFSLLPCPFPSSGIDAPPILVIVYGASLQPPSSPAPPLACKVYFLIAAPTTHLGSARSSSSSSLPPSSGEGLKKKANLTATLLS